MYRYGQGWLNAPLIWRHTNDGPHAQIQRTVAYHEVSESVSKWIPIIKRNREVGGACGRWVWLQGGGWGL